LKRRLSPWYAGLLWNLSIFVVGSLASTLFPTIPFIVGWTLIYGASFEPPWAVLRVFQIFQGLVICLSGGWWTARAFRLRFECAPEETRRWILGFQAAMLAVLLGSAGVLAWLHYGNIFREREGALWSSLSALLLFGSFVPMFLLSSRHFWRRYSEPAKKVDDGPLSRGS